MSHLLYFGLGMLGGAGYAIGEWLFKRGRGE